MRNTNTIEEIHENIDMAKGFGLMEDDDVIDALLASSGDDFTVVMGEGIFGNTIDVDEFEDCQLTIKMGRSLGYYASS